MQKCVSNMKRFSTVHERRFWINVFEVFTVYMFIFMAINRVKQVMTCIKKCFRRFYFLFCFVFVCLTFCSSKDRI